MDYHSDSPPVSIFNVKQLLVYKSILYSLQTTVFVKMKKIMCR